VRERQRPADYDERIRVAALVGEHGNTGEVEHLEHARDLELVAHRKGDDVELRHRPLVLVGDQRQPRRGTLGDVVGQKGALGGGVWTRVDLAVDGLKAERAHSDVVGARIAERDAARRLLEDRPLLGAEPVRDRLYMLPTRHANPQLYPNAAHFG